MLQGYAQYPSFIVFCSIALCAFFSMVITPLWKRILKKSHIGQQVRIDGPETHLVKQGTPTMGGVVMLIAMILTMGIMGI